MSDRDDFGAFIVGFLVGGLTGAAVALLFAPQSGAETRALIRDKAIELKDKASESIEDAYTRAESAAKEAKLRADELTAIARLRAGELGRKGQVLLEEQKAMVSGAVEGAKKGAAAAKAASRASKA
ncbi:MAG: YtxH domain-containing protein [Anaerolineaceae bacterium]